MSLGTNTREVDILLIDVNPSFPPIPPLGLEVLASALDEKGFRVEILSASPFLPDYSRQMDGLGEFRPGLVGLQIRNYDWAILRYEYPALRHFHKSISRTLGVMFPSVPLVLGGIGFSIDPQFWLRELKADFGIVGSAEVPLTRLLSALLRGDGNTDDIPGLVTAGRPANPAWFPERLSRVCRGHFDYMRWRQPRENGLPWANVETHRGCCFRCAFCVEPATNGRNVVFKDPEDVIAELRELLRTGIHRFFFCNSEFNLFPAYALALCRALSSAGLGERIRWWTYAVPVDLSLELCLAMVLAGCESISFNAVHVNDGILASFRCPHRLTSYERCLDNAEEAGVSVSNTFLLGSALETDETSSELMSFIDRRRVSASISFGLAHYPVLPRSTAMERTPETRVFVEAGNGTIPYSLRLSPCQASTVALWASSRRGVLVQNRAPELWVAENEESPDPEFLRLIRDAAGVDEVAADCAVRDLREALPLLDLPVVQLGVGAASGGAPPEPGFRLYSFFHSLSRFYQALQRFFKLPATPDAIARLFLRLVACGGEFPRLLEAARDFLDADSLSWLREKWQGERLIHQLVFATSYACQSRCPYCYAKGVDRGHQVEMTLERFRLGLRWAEKQGCRIISFAGGEPTLHPMAERFFEEVRLRGLRTYFNSNLLCEPRVIVNFNGSWVLNVGIHAQALRYTPPEQRAHFDSNVGSLRARGVPLYLRYNFDSQTDQAIDDALALSRTLRVRQVNFAIPIPSLDNSNRHSSARDLLDNGQFLLRATEAFRAEGLKAILSKPIPPCAVPEDKLRFLRAGEALSPACNIVNRGWTQNVLVGPDLTISPCIGVTTPGPSLLDFRSFADMSEYLVDHLKAILRPRPFAECATCNFHLDRRCLGGCLAYFVDEQRRGKRPFEPVESFDFAGPRLNSVHSDSTDEKRGCRNAQS